MLQVKQDEQKRCSRGLKKKKEQVETNADEVLHELAFKDGD